MTRMPAMQVAGIFIMGFVHGESRDQGSLFPVSLDELVPEDHVCRVIDAFVESLDLAQLGFSRAEPRTKLKKRKGVAAPRPSADRTACSVVKRHLSVYDET